MLELPRGRGVREHGGSGSGPGPGHVGAMSSIHSATCLPATPISTPLISTTGGNRAARTIDRSCARTGVTPSHFRDSGRTPNSIKGGRIMVRVVSGRRRALVGGIAGRRRPAPTPRVPIRTTPDRLRLTSLLAVASLTPAQAVALGTDLLTALEEREPTCGSRPEAVWVGLDGRPCLTDGGSDSADVAADIAAARLLEELIAATRASSPADDDLFAALERAAVQAREPDGRLAVAAAVLRAADATGGARARAELARLVAAATGAVTAVGHPPPPAPGPPAPSPPAHRPRRRVVVTRTWKIALPLVVLVAVVLTELALLRDEINRDVNAVLESGRSSAPAEEVAPTLPPVVPPAPPAAGPITRIDLRPVQPCVPDADCPLRMQVMLQPRPEPQSVSWQFQIVDRCSGGAVTVPGGTLTVPPDGDRADAVSTVALPAGGALAVMALITQPATAASRATPVPAAGGCGS